MGHEGHGIKIKKGGSFIAEVVSLSIPGASVSTIDMSTQDTTGLRVLIPAALADPGSASITVRFRPDLVGLPVIGGAPEEIEFIFTLDGEQSFTIYGFFTDWTPGEFVSGQAMDATMTLQRTGVPDSDTPGSGNGINPGTGAVVA